MNYFVIGDQGQKYGPVDVATLNKWIAEQRIMPQTMLEHEQSGGRIAASAVPGLNFPPPVMSSPQQAPRAGTTYAPGQVSVTPSEGPGRAILAIVLGIISPFCSYFFWYGGILTAGTGIDLAWKSKNHGQTTLGWVGTVLNAVAIVFWLMTRILGIRYHYNR